MQMEKAHALSLVANVMRDHGAANDAALQQAIGRAERRAGLTRLTQIDEEQLNTLLLELAAEGGRIQQVAETIAAWRAESGELASEETLGGAR
jgi:hypothetical protein